MALGTRGFARGKPSAETKKGCLEAALFADDATHLEVVGWGAGGEPRAKPQRRSLSTGSEKSLQGLQHAVQRGGASQREVFFRQGFFVAEVELAVLGRERRRKHSVAEMRGSCR